MLKETKRKLTVQLWTSAAEAVKQRIRSLRLQRDAYLGDLLTIEIERLATEIICKNPPGAASMIRKHLGTLKREKVTIAIDEDLAARIDSVLEQRDIPRDAFVNRIFFFLIAKAEHLALLEVGFQKMSTDTATPLIEVSGLLKDPFFDIRQSNGGKFYSICLPVEPIAKNWPSLFGLNCLIDENEWDAINSPFDLELFNQL